MKAEKNTWFRFTLVELLIVIAVIAIMAAMLLPSLQQARNTVKQTACKNNIRQLVTTLHSYLDEWNGSFPYVSGATKMMQIVLTEHLYPNPPANYSVKTVFVCPSAPGTQLQQLSYSSIYLTNTYSICKGPNLYGLKLNMFAKPSKFIYFCDGYGDFNAFQSDMDSHVYYRHNARINTGYLDAHVENKKYKVLMNPSTCADASKVLSLEFD